MLFSRTGWTRKSDYLHEQVHEQTRAIRNFNLYLYGQPVLLRIDNAAVSWMRNLKTPTGQVVRWLHITCCSPTWMHYQETIVRHAPDKKVQVQIQTVKMKYQRNTMTVQM